MKLNDWSLPKYTLVKNTNGTHDACYLYLDASGVTGSDIFELLQELTDSYGCLNKMPDYFVFQLIKSFADTYKQLSI